MSTIEMNEAKNDNPLEEHTEEKMSSILDSVSEPANTAAEALNAIDSAFQKLKEQVYSPEKREEVLLSIITDATNSLIAVDKQFTDIAMTMDSLLKGHNKVIRVFNEVIGNPNYFASLVDKRLEEREKLDREAEMIICLKSKMTCVHFGEFKPLEVGQIGTFIRYPSTPEQFSEEDLDKVSSNIVMLCNEPGKEEQVFKKDNNVLFSAASLFLSETFTEKAQKGEVEPRVIRTIDNQDYALMETFMVIEIQSTSIDSPEEIFLDTEAANN